MLRKILRFIGLSVLFVLLVFAEQGFFNFFESEYFAIFEQLPSTAAVLVLKVLFVWWMIYVMVNGVRHFARYTARWRGRGRWYWNWNWLWRKIAAMSEYTTAVLSLMLTLLNGSHWF